MRKIRERAHIHDIQSNNKYQKQKGNNSSKIVRGEFTDRFVEKDT